MTSFEVQVRVLELGQRGDAFRHSAARLVSADETPAAMAAAAVALSSLRDEAVALLEPHVRAEPAPTAEPAPAPAAPRRHGRVTFVAGQACVPILAQSADRRLFVHSAVALRVDVDAEGERTKSLCMLDTYNVAHAPTGFEIWHGISSLDVAIALMRELERRLAWDVAELHELSSLSRQANVGAIARDVYQRFGVAAPAEPWPSPS